MRFQKEILVLIFTLFTGLSSANEPKVLTVVADEWCPYNCTPNSDKEGFGIEFVRAIYEAEGIKVDYKLKSWDEAVADTRKGLFDVAISAYKTDAPGFVFPENPYAYSIACFFVKSSNSWKFEGISSLGSQKIGAINGYSYGIHIDNYIKKNKNTHVYLVSGEDPLIELFAALKNNTITTILEDEAVFKYMNRTRFPDVQTREAGCQHPGSLYLAFSPANPESKNLAEIFDRGFINLRRSGKYREILNKYGLDF